MSDFTFELPAVSDTVQHGKKEFQGFHFPTGQGGPRNQCIDHSLRDCYDQGLRLNMCDPACRILFRSMRRCVIPPLLTVWFNRWNCLRLAYTLGERLW